MIRVAFLGTPYIGSAALKSLADNDDIEVVVAVTTIDKPVGRNQSKLMETPVALLARQYDIPVIKTTSINKDIDLLKEYEFDYMLTCAFGQFLSDDVLALPKKKALNIHGSLLPEGRGGAPLHWAIITGKKKTGISIMEMVSAMDAGDYYSQYEIEIKETDTCDDLFRNMSNLILEKSALGLIEVDNGKEGTKQDESKVTFWMNITKEDKHVSFNDSAENIYNKVRGLNSKPMAETSFEDKMIKIHETKIGDYSSNEEPGTVIKIDKEGAHVSTKDNVIIIKKVTFPGSAPVVIDSNNAKWLENAVLGKTL